MQWPGFYEAVGLEERDAPDTPPRRSSAGIHQGLQRLISTSAEAHAYHGFIPATLGASLVPEVTASLDPVLCPSLTSTPVHCRQDFASPAPETLAEPTSYSTLDM
ncbi:hypothetical protein BD626DRAFT_575856 [Schizophyllum amplum]|uniref:Uncharacterized protein n=1 Tax=Schizophyllum amplum TaxID=97359 RepID=A0A550BUW5_9AGAR|nr:hypothetical protein BD626DRAFT_575856 [Auriculariopsis ampla]